MPSKKLSRTSYHDPTLTGSPIRSGDVARGEAALDMDEHYRSLEQIHGSGTHGWGVADGLRVAATLNQAGISVLPGIAIDAQGRHIALAEGGNAEIGPNADVPGTPPTLVGVTANGATVLTAALAAGNYYITIQWWELFDTDAYNNYGVYRINHTPWIRLQQVDGFADDGSRLVLAKVTLGDGGVVTGMTQELRRAISLPAQVLRLRKGIAALRGDSFVVDNASSGEVRARAAGGIELAVPNKADEIHLLRDGGNFAKLSVAAQEIAARRSDGKESVVIDTQEGNITAGTQEVGGDILVKDARNRLVISLSSLNATIVVGAAENEGNILVKDNAGQNSVRVDGSTGNISGKRITPTAGNSSGLDVDARFFRIHGWDLILDGRSGGNKRALVDLGNRLVVNHANDYANGVDINKLHLSDHIKTGFWEEDGPLLPEGTPAGVPTGSWWIDLFTQDTGLPDSEWFAVTMCEVGMSNWGSISNDYFWWKTKNDSRVNGQGNIVISWSIKYYDNGGGWQPTSRSVMWVAFRR